MSLAATYIASGLHLACGLVLGLLSFSRAFALPADLALSQLHHTQWTVQSGAPGGITSMAQTRDGYIWMAANGRLFRFDGVEFERVDRIGASPLPAEKVFAVWAAPSGGLWISHQFGGATFIGDGTMRTYFAAEGLPHATVLNLVDDGKGHVWAGTSRGLLRLEAGRWTFVDNWQIPPVAIVDLILDREDTLWLTTADALFYLRRGSPRFELGLQLPNVRWPEWTALMQSPDGQIWLMRSGVGLTPVSLPTPGKSLVPQWRAQELVLEGTFSIVLIDRDSKMWMSNSGRISRFPLPDSEEAAPISQKTDPGHVRLAGEEAGAMLEDREGNIWVASSGGLQKFRAPTFVPIPIAQGQYQGTALAAAEDASVWVGRYDSQVLHRIERDSTRESVRIPEPIYALHRDQAGTLWVGGTASSIYHLSSGRWIEWRLDGVENVGGIQAIVRQPDGTVWVSVVRVGVYRVINNRWTLWGGLADLPREPATTLALDPDGRVWLGYVNSRIAVIDQDRVVVYDAADGLSIGAVLATAVQGRHFWVGGEKGLNWFDGQRFHSVHGGEQTSGFGSVNGIVEKADGDLWLNTSDGAVLIPFDDVRTFVAMPNRPIRFRLFNYLDGMPGAADELRPLPTAIASADGRLWFSTTNGVVTLAPRPPAPNPIVPNVYVKSITVDGTRSDMNTTNASSLQLPSNPHVLQIAYTALSFAMPERVRFKYRLEGTDMGWQDVGMRREAQFTGLPPGSYRFQVIASNDSGVWNETGASLEFVIPTTFTQSRQFIVLCVAAVLIALWLLFALRMRQVKTQLLSRNEERLMERERIARELHDTFLQGVQGLMLRFQSAAERIPEDAPARQLMEDALDRADRVLTEGRDKVSELRSSVSLDLVEALKMVGKELSRDHAVSFNAHVEGATRELNPLVQEEAFRIGAEALTNAFRHASASQVNAIVLFGRRQLELRLVDDGIGFDVSQAKPGRWGLKGIRERAERIRGKVVVSSQTGVGTTVELQIPAKLAYQEAAGTRWSRRRNSDLVNIEDAT